MSGTVRDVMTKVVVSASPDASFTELVRLMHDRRVSAVVIVDEDDLIVGVVSEADLLLKRDPEAVEWHLLDGAHRRSDRRKALGRVARELMSAPPITAGPDVSVGQAAHRMHEAGVKCLPVVDGAGHVLGVVARTDLLRAFLQGDGALAEQVESFLARVASQPDAVHIAVHAGVVDLAGLVQLRTSARRIADRVRMLDGVVAVDAERLDWEVDDTVPPVSAAPWVGF